MAADDSEEFVGFNGKTIKKTPGDTYGFVVKVRKQPSSSKAYQDIIRDVTKYYEDLPNKFPDVAVKVVPVTLEENINVSDKLEVKVIPLGGNIGSGEISSRINEYDKYHEKLQDIQIKSEIPISIDNPQRDKKIIVERVMEELCRRYRGNLDQFSINEIWQSAFPAFHDKTQISNILRQYERESQNIHFAEDMISLTAEGVRYCQSRE